MKQQRKIKRALISVYDKTGLLEFARALVDEFGIEIISTGGTAKHLKEGGIPVTLVEDITGFPEMLDGRVKTLHPKIHAAILADRDNPDHMRQLKEQGIEPIDMVVVNLYPFETTIADPNCTFEQAIEMIDIGGPCLLRAAAKNHKHVWVCLDPAQYKFYMKALRNWSDSTVRTSYLNAGGFEAFGCTERYDATVFRWLVDHYDPAVAMSRLLRLWSWGPLRYGENPHQTGETWSFLGNFDQDLTIAPAQVSGNPELSYNNFADAHAALELCKELTRARKAAACAFIKHTNACGVSVALDRLEAYRHAYLADPNAAMGGVLACNFEVDSEFARGVMDTYDRWGRPAGAGGFFVEVWIALSFMDDAIEIIRTTKKWGEKVRLLPISIMNQLPDNKVLEYRSVAGGMLVQTPDLVGLNEDQWKVVTKRKPTESEISDLRLAWLIAKHTKSNAISICKDGMLIGNGAGQMSRVMSCRIAAWLAKENKHEDKLKGSVAASDAFFPFPDGPNILMDAGVTAIIQPGGSKNDEKAIAACDERGVAMIFTGTRHFKH
jgi:phosphoribosylaminoimidazolecarboxamide formyltransferase/IMP cyclohydrolase